MSEGSYVPLILVWALVLIALLTFSHQMQHVAQTLSVMATK